MNPFYRTKNINVITEKQVKDGEEIFNFTTTDHKGLERKEYNIDNKDDTPRQIHGTVDTS